MALLVVMMALTLLTGLGTALIVGTMTETAVAAGYRQGIETFYAAEAAVEFAVRDLAGADSEGVLSGTVRSSFVDGPADGTRQAGGRVLDLAQETAEIDGMLAARAEPAGAAALYASGTLAALLAADIPRLAYVCVWVAERLPAEDAEEEDPPVRLLYVIGRAYGPVGAQRTVLVTMARALDADAETAFEVRSWEEPP